jgi:hypothetical protein
LLFDFTTSRRNPTPFEQLRRKRLTVCVSRWWAGRDSLREQEKPEARKMPENGAESHQSAARFVGWQSWKDTFCQKGIFQLSKDDTPLHVFFFENLASLKFL